MYSELPAIYLWPGSLRRVVSSLSMTFDAYNYPLLTHTETRRIYNLISSVASEKIDKNPPQWLNSSCFPVYIAYSVYIIDTHTVVGRATWTSLSLRDKRGPSRLADLTRLRSATLSHVSLGSSSLACQRRLFSIYICIGKPDAYTPHTPLYIWVLCCDALCGDCCICVYRVAFSFF